MLGSTPGNQSWTSLLLHHLCLVGLGLGMFAEIYCLPHLCLTFQLAVRPCEGLARLTALVQGEKLPLNQLAFHVPVTKLLGFAKGPFDIMNAKLQCSDIFSNYLLQGPERQLEMPKE